MVFIQSFKRSSFQRQKKVLRTLYIIQCHKGQSIVAQSCIPSLGTKAIVKIAKPFCSDL